jgi:hypothetical protein
LRLVVRLRPGGRSRIANGDLEAAAYAIVARPRDAGRALAASAVANGASFGVGLVLPALM